VNDHRVEDELLVLLEILRRVRIGERIVQEGVALELRIVSEESGEAGLGSAAGHGQRDREGHAADRAERSHKPDAVVSLLHPQRTIRHGRGAERVHRRAYRGMLCRHSLTSHALTRRDR
jgi:hypothetical protein